MQEQVGASVTHQEQDKVRIRSGNYKGQKGTIRAVISDQLVIQLESGAILHVGSGNITNQSLAARKAWRTMREQKE